MKGYKAFEKGLVCRGKQYKEHTVFEEEKAEICHSGMHFCKEPLDVMKYYPLVDDNGNMSEFAEVEAFGECVTNDNEKYCTKKLRIGAKISFAELVQASVNFELEKTAESKVKTTKKDNAKIASKEDSAQIGSSGYSAQIGSSGNSAKINSKGKHAVICCTGHNSIAKGKVGSWITLSEWEYSEAEKAHIPICVKTERIDGERIKEDTYYKLVKGNFVEV
jgi:hypothetical protein